MSIRTGFFKHFLMRVWIRHYCLCWEKCFKLFLGLATPLHPCAAVQQLLGSAEACVIKLRSKVRQGNDPDWKAWRLEFCFSLFNLDQLPGLVCSAAPLTNAQAFFRRRRSVAQTWLVMVMRFFNSCLARGKKHVCEILFGLSAMW